MTVEKTHIEGCFVIQPKIFNDSRGYFFERYNQKQFEKETSLSIKFVQENQSKSHEGVLRGLHFQEGEHAQAKLVGVINGAVLDIVVDIRKDSKTFGQYFSIILDSKENKQLFIPRGMAHGFLALKNNTIFNYKCDNYYNKASEKGIIYNDKYLNIDWNYPEDKLIISDKDITLPTFESLFK